MEGRAAVLVETAFNADGAEDATLRGGVVDHVEGAERIVGSPEEHSNFDASTRGEAEDVYNTQPAGGPLGDGGVIEPGGTQTLEQRLLFGGAVRAGALVAPTNHLQEGVEIPVGEPDALLRGEERDTHGEHSGAAIHKGHGGIGDANGGVVAGEPGEVVDRARWRVPCLGTVGDVQGHGRLRWNICDRMLSHERCRTETRGDQRLQARVLRESSGSAGRQDAGPTR